MYKKKLIETSIPLEEINEQSIREKALRKGHPSTLHLWWARRPLAAARCVIFSSMVDDPSEHPELFPTEAEQDKERNRLHGIIRRLANWDNIGDELLYKEAFSEITKYSPDGVIPEFLDPFAGGGALPLEAQRLGLVANAADLNPIPVTLNRAMIDIPARFCGQKPIHPGNEMQKIGEWPRATGLADDVDYYAQHLRKAAIKQLGSLYPTVTLHRGSESKEASPIAYFWTRTVKCPNPACRRNTPLVRSFVLAKKKGRRVYIDPSLRDGDISYEIRSEANGWRDFSEIPEKTVGRRGAKCVYCGSPISLDFIRAEGQEHGLEPKLIAIACESPFDNGRWYTKPDEETMRAVETAKPNVPSALKTRITNNPRDFKTPNYGLTRFMDLYTNRQLQSLSVFSDLVAGITESIEKDAIRAGLIDDGVGLDKGGRGARAYAEAITVYLACIVDKLSDYCSSICTWHNGAAHEKISHVFARQAVPMTWDFAEVNPLSMATGSFYNMSKHISDVLRALPANPQGFVVQRDARTTEGQSGLLVSTDPPYYDNIDYADLSDFFYIWMRRCLREIYPDTFATLMTPKDEELVASPYRFRGGAQEAKLFFENGMRETFSRLAQISSEYYPLTVYYAYKQSETNADGRTSSGWETMLQALMDSGFQITGTWPIRTEMANRTLASDSNALASSIVLVCRKRDKESPIATRPEFQRELRKTLKRGLDDLRQGSIAPVDMAQASIGPGMAAFSQYSKVVESDGNSMSVHTALAMINEQLDALMGESGEELDAETRFCLTWYQQFGFAKGDFGTAETLRNARGADFGGLVRAGVLANERGKTWLVRPVDVANPVQPRLFPSCWSDLMTMVAALESGGIDAAAEVAKQLDETRAEHAKSLAYLLFQAAENGKRTEDATWFNDFVTSWSDISERAEQLRRSVPVQLQFDFNV